MIFFLAPLALLYVFAYLVTGILRPRYLLAAIVSFAPFQNDLSIGGPVRFSLTEINLLLAMPVLLLHARTLRLSPAFWPATAYIVACLASLLVGESSSALTSLVQTGLYLLIAVCVFASLGKSAEDFRLCLNGYLLVSALISVVICVQRTGYVLGLHKNGIGDSLAVAVIIALELSLSARGLRERLIYLATLLITFAGMFISLSRGGWMCAAVGVVVLLLLRREIRLLGICALVLAPVALISWQFLDADLREYAFGFSSDRENIRLRLESIDFAVSKFESSPLIGVGVGLRKDYDCTNVFLMLLAETGIFGAITFIGLQATVAWTVYRYSRFFPKHTFSFSTVVLGGALVFGKIAHGMVDHYWSRGALSVSWAAFGMASCVGALELKSRRMALLASMDSESLAPQMIADGPEASLLPEQSSVATLCPSA